MTELCNTGGDPDFALDEIQAATAALANELEMSTVQRPGGTGGGGISSRMAELLQPASGLLLTCFETRYDQALGRLH